MELENIYRVFIPATRALPVPMQGCISVHDSSEVGLGTENLDIIYCGSHADIGSEHRTWSRYLTHDIRVYPQRRFRRVLCT